MNVNLVKLAVKYFSMQLFDFQKQKSNWLWQKYCKIKLFSGAILYGAFNELEAY